MVRGWAALAFSFVLSGCGHVGVPAGDNRDRRTPLEKAAQAGDSAEVRQLLASGADPNDRNGALGSALNAAALRHDNAQVIGALIAAGSDVDGRGQQGNSCWISPLHMTASTGDIENIQALLDSGARVSESDCRKLVVGWLRPDVIDLLVRYGLNITSVDQNGRNALHLALAPPITPSLAGVKYLINAGVPVNARDHRGETPLALWRKPREFETSWFTVWLIEHLSHDSDFQQQRENRANISALLAQSGAVL
jgi:ankyrin repeat protein